MSRKEQEAFDADLAQVIVLSEISGASGAALQSQTSDLKIKPVIELTHPPKAQNDVTDHWEALLATRYSFSFVLFLLSREYDDFFAGAWKWCHQLCASN